VGPEVRSGRAHKAAACATFTFICLGFSIIFSVRNGTCTMNEDTANSKRDTWH
jgi:hypothetical protein